MPDCLYLCKSRVDLEAEARGEKDVLARHEAELLRTARRLGRTVGAIYREVGNRIRKGSGFYQFCPHQRKGNTGTRTPCPEA